MDTSLLVSESIFVKIPNESPTSPNYHDSIEELRDEFKSLSWDQLISLDLEQTLPTLNESKSCSVKMTKMEALHLLNIAATLLQRNIRRYFQQQKYRDFLVAYKAAVRIQSLWRGYRTRKLDVRVLQIKYNYIISKFQERMCTINENYENRIENVNKDKDLLIKIVSLLSSEIENLKDVSLGLKVFNSGVNLKGLSSVDIKGFEAIPSVDIKGFDAISSVDIKEFDAISYVDIKGFDAISSVDIKGTDIVSSAEMKGSDPTTPTNDKISFYINNPHLTQTDSGINVNMSDLCNDDSEKTIENKHSDIAANNCVSEVSPVISFEEKYTPSDKSTTPKKEFVNSDKANQSIVSSSMAVEDNINNPLDTVDGINAIINDILYDESDGRNPDHEHDNHENDFMQADSVEFLNDSLQSDDCLDNSVHNEGTQFLYDSLQMDSLLINPIEADSLQFIHDSLQAD